MGRRPDHSGWPRPAAYDRVIVPVEVGGPGDPMYEGLLILSRELGKPGAETARLLLQDAMIQCGVLKLAPENRSKGARRSAP